MTTTTERRVDNGVNVQALIEAREALSGAPEAAKFNWRAKCDWVNGTHSRSEVKGFYGLGEEQSHKTTTPRFSPPRTTAPPPWSWCSQGSPAA